MFEFLRGNHSKTLNDASSIDEALSQCRRLALSLESKNEDELRARTQRLRDQARGEPAIENSMVLAEAAALVSESIRRVIGLRLHNVQLRGALIVASGRIAEMQTGEGKTLVAAAGAFSQCLNGLGVHVSTTNAYLAQRDFEFVAPAFRMLGVTAGFVSDGASAGAARDAYECDITYATGYQFGFDYLRDQVLLRQQSEATLGQNVTRALDGRADLSASLRHRGFSSAIIDEADSVLIDEAMTPLVLAGAKIDEKAAIGYRLAHQLIQHLVAGRDFTRDGDRFVLSVDTKSQIHSWLRHQRPPKLYRPWSQYVENALHASLRLERDRHYVVKDDKVQIVDQNTGRIFADRSWSEGLHQAVEAKEGIEIRQEEISNARITRQRFFRLYNRVAGLTGTATDAAEELEHFYKLSVIVVPTNVPCRRERLPTRFFSTVEAKYSSICESVREHHLRGQPVLIGTTTIDQTRQIATRLAALSVPHAVLNGLQDADEAGIIAQAGQSAAVTVATNMAGRGTDIQPCPEALQLGGLHVIAIEHAQSRRIDRQLQGRSARQGDPGSCQFFASAEDELIAQHESKLAKRICESADPSGQCMASFEAEIEQLQRQLESSAFQQRRHAVQCDEWFDSVRKTLH
ncbi:MAG: hypothetical protein AAFX06_04955 [Planctomycetota bacterium]